MPAFASCQKWLNVLKGQFSAIFSKGSLSSIFLLRFSNSFDNQCLNVAYIYSLNMAIIYVIISTESQLLKLRLVRLKYTDPYFTTTAFPYSPQVQCVTLQWKPTISSEGISRLDLSWQTSIVSYDPVLWFLWPSSQPDDVHTNMALLACLWAKYIPSPSSPTQKSILKCKSLRTALLRVLKCILFYQQNKLLKTLIFQLLLVNQLHSWEHWLLRHLKMPATRTVAIWQLSKKNICYC